MCPSVYVCGYFYFLLNPQWICGYPGWIPPFPLQSAGWIWECKESNLFEKINPHKLTIDFEQTPVAVIHETFLTLNRKATIIFWQKRYLQISLPLCFQWVPKSPAVKLKLHFAIYENYLRILITGYLYLTSTGNT